MTKEAFSLLLLVAISLPKQGSANDLFDTDLDDLLSLFRYLIGLAFTIFGMFFLVYKDYAARVFVQFYDSAEIVSGYVVACQETSSRTHQVQVVFAVPRAPLAQPQPMDSTAGEILLQQQEYMLKYDSQWLIPQGTSMDLYYIPGKPRSAVTKDRLESTRSMFSWAKSLSVLVPGMMLVVVFTSLCIDVINDFPNGSEWTGWVAFVICSGWIVLASWSICDYQFQDYAKKYFLSAYPVQRRDSNGNIVPPPTVVVTPKTSSFLGSIRNGLTSSSKTASSIDQDRIPDPEGVYYNADAVV